MQFIEVDRIATNKLLEETKERLESLIL